MAATLPNNLPLPLSSFVGREREIAEVKQLLATSRLVTLTGAGGCGKTRLALQVGRDVPTERLYEHGVWFVTLAALADPALVPHAVASGFGVREPPNQLLLATLTSFLRDKYLLLILDNCEHLIDECAQLVASLLQACAHLTILATSREPLNIDGEKVYLVPSLQVPGAESRVLSAEAQHSEAVQLFVARAQAVNASFALSAQNAQVVSRICQQLDGIPLAIELAAARTNVLSAAEIAARLSNSLALLTSGNRTALPRHQTMRAALDWSYELLNEPERALFRRLSVFAGGCTLEAVEFVCADELPQLSPRRGEGARTLLSLAGRGVGGEGGCDVLDMLARLVIKSLVLAEECPSTSARQAGETRYRLLEPVRQYAWQALQQAAEAEHLRARHLAYFCQFANEAEQQLRSADAIAWLNRLEIEQPNLRAATEWALASGTVSAGLSIGGALTWFCWFKGYWQEWRERLSELLAHPAGAARTLLRARALFTLGNLAALRTELNLMHSSFEECMAIAGELGDAGKPLLAMAYGYLAWGRKGHEFSIARRQMEESLRIAREAGEPWALAHSLIGMGVIAGIAGEYDAARGYYEESMHCFECAGDRLLSMVPRKNLGLALYRQGQLAAARICLEESAEVFQVIGGSVNLSEAQNALGAIAALDGQYTQARQFHLDALAFGRRSGDTEGIAEALICLGDVDRRENDYQSAGERYMESLQNLHTVGQKHLLSRAVESAAMLATVRGQAAVAASLFGAAEYMRQAGGYQLHPIEQPDHDRHISVLRQHLPEEALAQAWSLGQSWTLDSVIAAVRQLAAPEPHRAAPLRSPVPAALAAAGLTVREVAVLQQLAQGLSNPEIARQLNISPRTVDAHLRSIFSKLDVTSRTAAVRAASDLNIS